MKYLVSYYTGTKTVSETCTSEQQMERVMSQTNIETVSLRVVKEPDDPNSNGSEENIPEGSG